MNHDTLKDFHQIASKFLEVFPCSLKLITTRVTVHDIDMARIHSLCLPDDPPWYTNSN